MRNSRIDPFDLNLCIRGLGDLVTDLHSDIYEYAYILTFKRSMKMYAKEFNDSADAPIDDLEYFLTTGDLYVVNCYQAMQKLIDYKFELMRRFGIDEVDDLLDDAILLESKRYKPYCLISKRSKSYKKLILYYERLLVETIKCLYTYTCVLTAQSYKIPRVLTKQFDLPEPDCYRLLNSDDNNVVLLNELIVDLKIVLVDLRRINAEKLLKTLSNRRKRVVNKDKSHENPSGS